MTGGASRATWAVAAFAAAAVAASVALCLDARAVSARAAAHARSLVSLEPDLETLARCEGLATTLGGMEPPPAELPLPVALPAPESAVREDDGASAPGWTLHRYRLAWRTPPRSALDIMAALFNLDAGWHVSRLVMRGDGGEIAIEAVVSTARPVAE